LDSANSPPDADQPLDATLAIRVYIFAVLVFVSSATSASDSAGVATKPAAASEFEDLGGIIIFKYNESRYTYLFLFFIFFN